MRGTPFACYTADRENWLSWQGNEVWDVCARCGTSRPPRGLVIFDGKLVCGDDLKWCNDLVRDRGGFEVGGAGLTKDEREAIEAQEAALARVEASEK